MEILVSIAALALVIIIPGYLWSYVFFKREVDAAERAALSFGLSIPLVTFTIFFLNRYFGVEINALNSLSAITAVCVIPLGILLRNKVLAVQNLNLGVFFKDKIKISRESAAVVAVLLLATYIAQIPHTNYDYPVHRDEWDRITRANAIINSGWDYGDPFLGEGIEVERLELRASSARQPGRGKLVIEKGDIGYTKVGSDFGSFVNGENVKRDPRNTRSFMFSLPVAPLPAASKEAFRNLVSYSIYAPRDADLSTEPLEYSLQAGDLPGRGSIRMRSSARVGVLSLVAMSYLMLLVLGVNILRREGYFVLGGESKAVNLQYAAAFVRKTFENIPAGSLYVLLALLLLVATAFALMVDEAAANALAIAAYFFLVAGVVLRLFGMTKSSEKIFERVDPKLLMFLVKAVAVLALLSAGVAVGYEFLGKKGLLVASLPAIIVLGVLFSYVAKRLDESQHAREW